MKKISTTTTKQPRKKLDKYYTDDKTDSAVFFGLYHPLLMLLEEDAHPSEDGRRHFLFVEPCAGDGAMVHSLFKILRALPRYNELPFSVLAYDIAPGEREGLEVPIRQADLWELTPERIIEDSGLSEDVIRRIIIFSNPPYQIFDEPPRYNKDNERQTINVMKTLEQLTARLLAWSIDKPIYVELDMLLRLTQLEMTGTAVFMNSVLFALTVLKRMSFTGDGHTDMATTAWFKWDLADLCWDISRFRPDVTSETDMLQLIEEWNEGSKQRPLSRISGPNTMLTQSILRPFVHPDRSKNFDLEAEVQILVAASVIPPEPEPQTNVY